MKYKALADTYGWISNETNHQWTIGQEYEIVLDDENQVLISIQSNNGTSTHDLLYKFIDKNLMLKMFGIVLNTNEEHEE